MKKTILTIAAILSMSTMAYALPALQLDIAGGYYVAGAEETTISSGSVFDLYALADVGKYEPGKYYLSAALTPKTSTSISGGSFTVNGATVNVTADMTFGVPPLERLLGAGDTAATDSGDLSDHGIFETYFKEFEFEFDTTSEIEAYDVQAGNMGATPTAGTGLYYRLFEIDTTGLAAGYQIHFDLYSVKAKSSTDLDRDTFAPFSHDAQSGGAPVPEPGTMMLLGVGLFGLAIFGKRRMNK